MNSKYIVIFTLLITPVLGIFTHIYQGVSPSPAQIILGSILVGLIYFSLKIITSKQGMKRKLSILTFISSLLVLYILIINIMYGKTIIESLVLPTRILYLYLLFLTTYFIFLYNTISDQIYENIALYTLIIVIGMIIWDMQHGVVYYTYGADEISVGGGVAYYAPLLVTTIPIFIYFEKKVFSIISIVGILLALRRSALLATVGIFFFFILLSKKKIKVKQIIKYFLVLMLFLTIFAYMYSYTDFGVRLDARLADTSGSGRSIFWGWTLYLYESFDISEKIIGNPTVLQNFLYQKVNMHIGAHSDFLDYLVNYGLIGLILYVSFLFMLLQSFYQYRKKMEKEYAVAVSGILGFIMMSITTGGFFDASSALLFSFLGYLLAKMHKQSGVYNV